MLEEERYLSLNKDILEEELMKGGMYSDSLYLIRGCIVYVRYIMYVVRVLLPQIVSTCVWHWVV